MLALIADAVGQDCCGAGSDFCDEECGGIWAAEFQVAAEFLWVEINAAFFDF
jgi:hypothetical protein